MNLGNNLHQRVQAINTCGCWKELTPRVCNFTMAFGTAGYLHFCNKIATEVVTIF